MIVTRKIQIFVSEEDADKKKEYIHTLYDWRNHIVRGANIIASHKFVQQNVRDFVYFTDEIEGKFGIKDIIREGKGMSVENITYRVAQQSLKGIVPAAVTAMLNREISKNFSKEQVDVSLGKKSLRSYRRTLPIPLNSQEIKHLTYSEDDKRFYFTAFGITFGTALGADSSNNKVVLERVINGEYKMSCSSIQIDDKKKKFFLLLCVDMPVKEHMLNKEKSLYAVLGVQNPIVCFVGTEFTDKLKPHAIGTAEEFNYRRRQIQEAVRRCQLNNKYSKGGHGRKRKCKAVDRFHNKELNYVNTRMHTYSKELVEYAIKQGCGTIRLMEQKRREDEAQTDKYVLRNWSYSGIKDKIAYKCKLNNIELIVD